MGVCGGVTSHKHQLDYCATAEKDSTSWTSSLAQLSNIERHGFVCDDNFSKIAGNLTIFMPVQQTVST